MNKREPYCNCRQCCCYKCKKPFATWIKNKPKTFKQEQMFGRKCKQCYEKK